MSYGDPYDLSYMTTTYAREKMIEQYNNEAQEDESFKFKDHLYDEMDKVVTLTTDLDFPNGLCEYEIKVRDIFSDITTFIQSVDSAKRAKRFTDDLLTVLKSFNPKVERMEENG